MVCLFVVVIAVWISLMCGLRFALENEIFIPTEGSSVKTWGKEIDGYIVKMMTEEKAMQLLDEFLVCEISLLGTQLKGMTGNFQPATLQ